MINIDLNSDLGESFGPWKMGDDAALLELVSSANIACGFHAGDPEGMLGTLRAAAARDVAVGAHVGYRDLAGFGRRPLGIGGAALTADVIYQIGALQALAAVAGTRVRYVKPHGALYNTAAHDPEQGAALIAALTALGGQLPLLTLAGAPLVGRARAAGLTVIEEAFADRAYTARGTLMPRTEAGALLDDPGFIARRVVRFVENGTLEADDGSHVRVAAGSICVHGDSPGAVAIAREVRAALDAAGISVQPFTAGPCN